jgi:membrane dipeptidase
MRVPVSSVSFTLSALLALSAAPLAAQAADPALEHARRLLDATILIDGHNDLPWAIRTAKAAPTDVVAYDLRTRREGQTDFARLAEGRVSGQFWSIYIPGEIKDSGFARVQLEEFDIARRMIARYPDKLVLALTADDIVKAKKQKKIASLLGMEGGHAIENSLGALRAYYDLGARYMTLTHNVTLDWADAALGEPVHGGLTPFGKEVVREMNRLGMLVDLSHVAPSVMSDALTVSEAPVIFSHSSARGLVDHKRDVPDSILARLPKNGGVVMVTFVPSFVSEANRQAGIAADSAISEIRKKVTDSAQRRQQFREYLAAHPAPAATIADVANHIEHVRKIAGIDHVGIGSDFDGTDDLPVGLEDVPKFPARFAELIRRGWSYADLKKLAGENTLRAMRQAEAVAKRLQASRPASTATITQLDGKVPATD